MRRIFHVLLIGMVLMALTAVPRVAWGQGDPSGLAIQGVAIDDTTGNGNGNGYVDPGERVNLTVTLGNNGGETVTGITARLVYGNLWSPGVVPMLQDTSAYPDLAPGAAAGNTTPFRFFTDLWVGMQLPFILMITTDGGEASLSFTVNMGYWHPPTTLLFDDFESGAPGQTSTSTTPDAAWSLIEDPLAHSSTHCWHAGPFDPGTGDLFHQRLNSPSIAIPSIGVTMLKLWHTYDFTSEGSSYYLGTLVANVPAWGGENWLVNEWYGQAFGPMREEVFDLSSYGGLTISLGWIPHSYTHLGFSSTARMPASPPRP